VDGHPIEGWSLTSRRELTFGPGTHTVEVEVHDGHATATATLQLTAN
jgi:hypothetical protein